MSTAKTILVIGTFDTKRNELKYIQSVIEDAGGAVLTMDVGILGESGTRVNLSKHEVAEAANVTMAEVIATGDENRAMNLMSEGARRLAVALCEQGRIDGMLALGGTMGTDLALDVALALPLGFPKYIISTVAFSALIPPDRLAADVQMILWAGGLYGLNSICRAALSQAAGAVLGAARTATRAIGNRPIIGVSSLGNACLKYMKGLMPALEARGYEVAFFHAQGMGGRAMEELAARGMLVAVLDFCLQEFSNGLYGSVVSSGPERLGRVGSLGVPQIIAPGAADLVDWPSWQAIPDHLKDRPFHIHNKLITSLTLSGEERRRVAREMAARLNKAVGPTEIILPLRGIEEWDRPGEVGHDPASLRLFFDELHAAIEPPIRIVEVDAHINDPEFVAAALAILDRWIAEGLLPASNSLSAQPSRASLALEPADIATT